jgi:hypothetical protein
VPATVELGPVHDVVFAFGDDPDGGVGGEQGDAAHALARGRVVAGRPGRRGSVLLRPVGVDDPGRSAGRARRHRHAFDTIGNDGPEDSIDTRYAIGFPPRTAAASVPDECSLPPDSSSYDCPIGGLAANTSVERQVSVEIVKFNAGPVTVAVSDGQRVEFLEPNNRDSTVIRTRLASLWAAISPESVTVDIGEPAELTFTAGNDGPRDAIEPYVLFDLEDTVVEVSLPDGCRPNGEFGYACPIESLAAGTRFADTLTVRIGSADGARITVSAVDGATGESSHLRGTAEIHASTTSDIVVTAERVRVETELEEPFDVTVAIRNAGPADSDKVLVFVTFTRENEFLLPVLPLMGEGGEPVGANPQPDGCLPDSNWDEGPPSSLRCWIASPPAGASTDLTVRLQAFEYGTYAVPVTAWLIDVDETEAPEDRANNAATLTVEVVPPATGDGGSGGELPVTGIGLTGLVATGLALVAAGSTVTLLVRRRLRRADA